MDETPEIASSRLLGAGALLSLALLAGRLAGLIRETTLATIFGASRAADLAVLLLTLPDLLVNILLSGGLSASLVPRFKGLTEGLAAVQFRQVSILVGIGFGLTAIALATMPRLALRLLAPGLVITTGDISASSFFAVAAAIPVTALAGVSSAYLNAQSRFFVSGCGTLIFNMCVIASLLSGVSGQPLSKLCIGIFAGALLRWGTQLISIPLETWKIPRASWQLDIRFLKGFAAAAFASSLMMLVPLFVRAAASVAGPGYIAIFNYATKLVELPVGILITSVSVVALPRLSALYSAGDLFAAQRSARSEVQRAVLLAVAVLLPAFWFADSLTGILFGHGQMTEVSLARITSLTRIALLGLPFVALSSMAATDLYAQKRSSTVLGGTFVCLCLLPLFCSVGLFFSSANWLMGGILAFQLALALVMAKRDELSIFGSQGWFNSRMAWLLAQSALPTCFLIGLNWVFGVTDRRLHAVFAGAGFVVGAWNALRQFKSGRIFDRSSK